MKVCRTPGDRMDLEDVAMVAARPTSSVLHGELTLEVAPPVLAWTALNTDALVAYGDGRIDTVELVGRLRPYRG